MLPLLSVSFSKPSRSASQRRRTISIRSLTSRGMTPKRSMISLRKFSSSGSSFILSSCEYKLNLSEMLGTYVSGMIMGRSVSMLQSATSSFTLISCANSSLNSSSFNSRIASSSSLWYVSNPKSVMNPLCSAPSRFPAPRISKSRMAILKPSPKSENSSSVCSRFRESVLSVVGGGVSK